MFVKDEILSSFMATESYIIKVNEESQTNEKDVENGIRELKMISRHEWMVLQCGKMLVAFHRDKGDI